MDKALITILHGLSWSNMNMFYGQMRFFIYASVDCHLIRYRTFHQNSRRRLIFSELCDSLYNFQNLDSNVQRAATFIFYIYSQSQNSTKNFICHLAQKD